MRRGAGGEKIEDVVQGVLGRIEQKGVKKRNRVVEAWEKTVGENTINHAHPVSFKKGTMMIITENSVWSYKLTMEKRSIIKKFNEEYSGRQKLVEIRFRIGKSG
jgi:predicted nucleic acid-binding Zn ribbon protein